MADGEAALSLGPFCNFNACQEGFHARAPIPQNHARSTLHRRFCPYGFVLKPVGPETPIFVELGMVLFLNCRFRETMPDEFSTVDFPPPGSYESPLVLKPLFELN